MTDQLQELADELDVDLDRDTSEILEESVGDTGDVIFDGREISLIKPYNPSQGVKENRSRTIQIDENNQVSVTVKYRPECPSCSHILSEDDHSNQLSSECTICGVQTCLECKTRCEACEKPLCPDHAKGHGLKDNPYCSDCLGDVIEDIGFDRGMEKRKQGHSEEMDQLEKELKSEKQAKQLELKEEKQQRSQIRQDWKVVIQLLDTLKNDNEDDEEESGPESLTGDSGSSLTGGGDPIHGGDEEDDNSSEPDWLDSQFHDTEV